jgi:hypothetical protein
MKRSHYALPMLLGLLVLGGALYYSIRSNPDWREFDPEAFLQTLRGLDWRWLAVSMGAIYSTYFLRALRWRLLIRPLKPDPSLWGLVSATVIGFGAVGIMGRAGELVRPYLIARQEKLPVSGQLAAWLLERAFDTLMLLAAVGFAVGQIDLESLRNRPEMHQWIHTAGHAVGVVTALLLLLLLVLRRYYDPISEWLIGRLGFLSQARREPLTHFLEVFGQGLHSLRDVGSVLACLGLTIVLWVCILGGYYAVLASSPASPRLSFTESLIFMGIIMAGSIVQVPGVGGGVQITTVLALTEIFGAPVEVASGMALLIWALTFLAVVPPALALVAWNGLTWRKLRQLESEA